MSAVYIVVGVLLLVGCMRRAEQAPNWPSQIGWVIIAVAGLLFAWALSYAATQS